MEISQAGGRPGLADQQELWSLVKARRVVQQERQEARGFVEQRLGSLLFGEDLDQAQQAAYARKLAGTAARAAQLAEGPDLPDLKAARVSKDRLLWKAGGLGWRAFPVSQRAVAVSPLHRRLQDRLALALKDKREGSPEAARRVVHAVSITVARGQHTRAWNDQDQVELTGWGMEMLVSQKALSTVPTLPPAPAILLTTVSPSGSNRP